MCCFFLFFLRTCLVWAEINLRQHDKVRIKLAEVPTCSILHSESLFLNFPQADLPLGFLLSWKNWSLWNAWSGSPGTWILVPPLLNFNNFLRFPQKSNFLWEERKCAPSETPGFWLHQVNVLQTQESWFIRADTQESWLICVYNTEVINSLRYSIKRHFFCGRKENAPLQELLAFGYTWCKCCRHTRVSILACVRTQTIKCTWLKHSGIMIPVHVQSAKHEPLCVANMQESGLFRVSDT
jgi:hypothetical protein